MATKTERKTKPPRVDANQLSDSKKAQSYAKPYKGA